MNVLAQPITGRRCEIAAGPAPTVAYDQGRGPVSRQSARSRNQRVHGILASVFPVGLPQDLPPHVIAADRYASGSARDRISAVLDPDRFWQIHRGTIVNVAHVAMTVRDMAGRIRVKLKVRPEALAVSRAYAHRFRQM